MPRWTLTHCSWEWPYILTGSVWALQAFWPFLSFPFNICVIQAGRHCSAFRRYCVSKMRWSSLNAVQKLMIQMGIRSTPTFRLYKQGECVKTHVGIDDQKLRTALDSCLGEGDTTAVVMEENTEGTREWIRAYVCAIPEQLILIWFSIQWATFWGKGVVARRLWVFWLTCNFGDSGMSRFAWDYNLIGMNLALALTKVCTLAGSILVCIFGCMLRDGQVLEILRILSQLTKNSFCPPWRFWLLTVMTLTLRCFQTIFQWCTIP